MVGVKYRDGYTLVFYVGGEAKALVNFNIKKKNWKLYFLFLQFIKRENDYEKYYWLVCGKGGIKC